MFALFFCYNAVFPDILMFNVGLNFL